MKKLLMIIIKIWKFLKKIEKNYIMNLKAPKIFYIKWEIFV